MAKTFGHKSTKHEKIDKDNAQIVAAVGAAAFILVFSLFAVKALISQSFYQGRIIKEKKVALNQLEENVKSARELRNVYDAFVSEPENVLGGNPEGERSIDGDNAKIVLDALPSEYDYPGLSSSIEKILLDGGYAIDAIGGAEDQVLASSAGQAAPTPIPYPISIKASPVDTRQLIETLEKSIRPVYIDSLSIDSSQSGLSTSIGLRTFYLPGTEYKIGSKEIN